MDDSKLGDAILAKVRAGQATPSSAASLPPKTNKAKDKQRKQEGKAKQETVKRQSEGSGKQVSTGAPTNAKPKNKGKDQQPKAKIAPKPAQLPPTPKTNGAAPASGGSRRDVLLKEILSLGGTEDDLELIGGSGSSDEDDEEEIPAASSGKRGKAKQDAPPSAALLKELQSFVKELDFPPVATPASGASSSKAGPTAPTLPAPTKSERQAAASSALESLTARLDAGDAASEAKKAKKEARKEQRLLELEKRQQAAEEEAAQAQADAKGTDDIEARRQRRKEVKAQVESVKGRIESGSTSTRTGWLVSPRPHWYDTTGFPALSAPSVPLQPLPEDQISLLSSRGETLLAALSSQFADSLHSTSSRATDSILSSSDKAFVTKILTSGTSSDKLSALLLLVSSAPLHARSFLTTLMGMCRKRSREEAGRAVRGVIDWLRGGESASEGGLPNRKLKFFRDQPGLAAVAALRKASGLGKGKAKAEDVGRERQPGDEWLVLWAFEDWFKRWYMDLLRVIENFSVDTLPYIRSQSVSHSFMLLRDKPEQEQNLLRLLTNKLGDSDRSVASRASFHTLQVLQSHPLMKAIIVNEVAGLVLKSAAPATLAQTKAKTPKAKAAPAATTTSGSARHHDHARYYGTITLNQIVLAKADAQVANKLVEVYFELFKDILGRAAEDDAVEGVPADGPDGEDRQAPPPKLKHQKKAGLEEADEAAEKSSRLTAAILTGLNRAFPYASLDDQIFHSHLNTLFRIVHTGAFNVSVQALVLIQHIVASDERTKARAEKSKATEGGDNSDGLVGRFYRVLYGTLFDARLVTSSKQAMYLNLLFKSVKADPSPRRVCSFVKRIVQILPLHQPSFICGALYLLGELFSGIPGLRELSLTAADPADKEEYDGRKRDPLYANAESSRLWELLPLLNHFHPSVALNAQQLQSGQPVSASADLEQHTLSRFLDRFVYRNAKKASGELKGPSAMQPGAQGADRSGLVLMRKGHQDAAQPVNSADFANRTIDSVPIDQVFFHKYFALRAENEQARTAKTRKHARLPGGSDDDVGFDVLNEDESGSSDLDEEEVWTAMQASMPRMPGDADVGPDVDDSGSDPAFSDSDFGLADDDDVSEAEAAAEHQDGTTSSSSDVDWMLADTDADDESDTRHSEGTGDQGSRRRNLSSTDTVAMIYKRQRDEDDDPARGISTRDRDGKRRRGPGVFASAEDYARLLDAEDSEGS